MFSNPNIVEWISGLLLMIVSMAVLVGISSLIAWTVMMVLGDKEIRRQGEEKTLDTTGMGERKRTAA
jgi:hypothetical protein